MSDLPWLFYVVAVLVIAASAFLVICAVLRRRVERRKREWLESIEASAKSDRWWLERQKRDD